MRSLKTARRKMLLRTKLDRMSKLCCAPAQDAYSPARRVYGDDVLSFNPWHCIEEHRDRKMLLRTKLDRMSKLCCAPAQDAYSPARRVYGDDVLSFNPWHCIEEH